MGAYWRTRPPDEFPCPREVNWTTYGINKPSHELQNDDGYFDPRGLMLDDTPDTPLQALMEAVPGDQPIESKMELLALRDVLQDAIEQLDPRSHFVFDARVNRGASYGQISAELSVGKATAHRIMAKAVETLQRSLSNQPMIKDRLAGRTNVPDVPQEEDGLSE